MRPASLVDAVFDRLKAIYGSQKVGAMFAEASGKVVLAEWHRALERLDARAVHAALDRLAVDGSKWPPELPEFVQRVRAVMHSPAWAPKRLDVPARTAEELETGRRHLAELREQLAQARARRRAAAPPEPPEDDA